MAVAALSAPCACAFAATPSRAADDVEAPAGPLADDFGGQVPASAPGVAPTALEDAFFDLLWRCDSPVPADRDAAAEELTRRFREFETIWMDRAFLTDGEISAVAAARFLDAEDASRADRVAAALRSLDALWNVEPPRPDGDGVSTRRAALRLSWGEQTRFIWLAPVFRSCRWLDPADRGMWRPRARYSAPELQPDPDARFLDVETVLERADAGADDDVPETDDDDASAAAFDALIGVDCRPIAIPVRVGVGEEREFRSGDLTLRGASARRGDDSGRWRVAVRLQYDAAFDAFDSHRVWYDKGDFRLRTSASETPGAAPTRLRAMDRAPGGERVELEFDVDSAIDEAIASGAALLECRLPRFLVQERRAFAL